MGWNHVCVLGVLLPAKLNSHHYEPEVCVQVISERTKPRLHQYQSEVFVIIGGCTKDEKFVSEVTCLDPLRRSRLEVSKLPGTDTESESEARKWVEFACITFRNEVYLSGAGTERK